MDSSVCFLVSIIDTEQQRLSKVALKVDDVNNFGDLLYSPLEPENKAQLWALMHPRIRELGNMLVAVEIITDIQA